MLRSSLLLLLIVAVLSPALGCDWLRGYRDLRNRTVVLIQTMVSSHAPLEGGGGVLLLLPQTFEALPLPVSGRSDGRSGPHGLLSIQPVQTSPLSRGKPAIRVCGVMGSVSQSGPSGSHLRLLFQVQVQLWFIRENLQHIHDLYHRSNCSSAWNQQKRMEFMQSVERQIQELSSCVSAPPSRLRLLLLSGLQEN